MDLYCGVGFFGIELAGAVESFVGVEYDRLAIKAARQNAASRKITNGEFVAAKVEDVFAGVVEAIFTGADGGDSRPAAQGLPAGDLAIAAAKATGASRLCVVPSGDDGAGLEHFVRRRVSLNWRACSRWTCSRRRSTWNVWRICARDKALPNRKKWIQLVQLMATETRTDPRMNFVPRRLPWLLAAAMLLVYGLTLNHWVSLFNLPSVSKISGWVWQPEVLNPVTFLVTCPLRLLPASAIPLALNLFSAVCAALALGLLARSVALLPHDRTDAQRKREASDFAFLTNGSAWLPPLLAVLVCGLQLTFWECATNWTGEMFDLLLFAVVIWSLLEYRLGEREWRLYLAAFVFGAGMADDWGMTGFLPLFLVAIVWLRGFDFFNLRFLGRMFLCGLAGLFFCLLLPLLAVAAHKMPFTFWQYLKFNLSPQYGVLRLYLAYGSHPQQYIQQLSLLLAYLMPLFVLAIRWKSSFGDNSRIGVALASFMFHLLHAVFLAGCVWLVFDPPFSPRHRGMACCFTT